MTLHVLFEVAGAEYVLPASDVLQMESFEGATRVPKAPVYVVGIVQIRGRVVPVLDVRVRFGLPAIERALDSRLVVIGTGGRVVGLLVDRAREVIDLPESAFEAPPDAVSQDAHGFITAIARAKNRLVMRMDAEKVIGEQELGHG